ncbi:SoxR reducing system RseC family protein [Actinobacillus pleuropneumoniae]|uniref:SoxR reducing system RseC family protein n=6 Tax=Actinobacillus pleuropneumoniae TaxID=715 RepID=A0A9Q4DGB3_ACTPL|nr:SoxR reducing system RseC family protein [Actinobacillus pleuropneumoniae]ABN73500.1 putative sigma-E factor regulatory protein [Actinobacillus pleuropneumoniae serovar 5b str. L20]AWG94813.1 transcriptional regulator [Actinobacillus pleuropneumoniae serovar 1 str. 4074]AXA20886.1 transcriptional regulator [Actinobacillus pleuropneumoniae]EFL78800.1 putative sigma-E factor regulatory protein [Actinobacillus pleuropneumoniae serovar 2 str. 4226]EFL81477.1 putative sigma-E factor regulatory p
MMIETATVVDYQSGIATVQCSAKSACGGCAARNSCGTKSLSALTGEKFAPQFKLSVDMPLTVGDKVQIGLPEQTLLLSVFLIYCVPLFVLVLSAVIFSQLFANELFVALFMLISVSMTFWNIRRIMYKKRESEFTPVFLRRL